MNETTVCTTKTQAHGENPVPVLIRLPQITPKNDLRSDPQLHSENGGRLTEPWQEHTTWKKKNEHKIVVQNHIKNVEDSF